MMPSSRLFRSRWVALLWAGGILWTAVDVAASAPSGHPARTGAAPAQTDAMGEAVDANDLAAIVNAIDK